MKAVVIGASGHIGNAIVRELLQRKWTVTAAGRRSKPPFNLAGLRLRYLPGDVNDPGCLSKWTKGQDLIVDAAAPYPVEIFSPFGQGSNPLLAAEVRTNRILDAVSRNRARLLYIGSCVTMARPRTQAQQLKAKLIRTAHPYFHVKEVMERLTLEASRSGLPAVVINPTYCLGPWDIRDRNYCTIPLLLNREIPSSIRQALQVIDVRDVAAAALSAVESERYGEAILTSAYKLPTHDLYRLVCELAGVESPRYSFATEAVAAGSYLLEALLGFASTETPLSAGAIMISTMFDYLEPKRELEELGVIPRLLEETLADSIQWYRKIGYC